MISRRILLCAFALAGLLGTCGAAAAQAYPDKPIKLVVPYPPGGPIDTMARLVAQQLSARVGQVIVENRPGGGAILGSKSVAAADPDGYTLLFGSSGSLAVAPALYVNADYEPLKLFAPVATVALLPHVFVVPPAVPAKTVQEFVAYAKANPGKLNYGSAIGTPPHLLSTLFKFRAGLDILYVPYKGSAQSVTDLLGGQTHMTIDGLTTLSPLIKEGKLRPLAIAGAARWPELPDVPTLIESGYPDFNLDAWTGVVAPAATPREIIDKLNAAINDGLQSADAKASLIKLSAVPKIGSPQDFAAFLAGEMPKWAGIVKLTGAKVE